jgi:hypothetical protein
LGNKAANLFLSSLRKQGSQEPLKRSPLTRGKHDVESGNVIWFLLIAVALLGMLTMVLTRSGSTVDQSGDVEQRRIKGSELLRYTKSIETAVQAMIVRGVSENDISFQNTVTATDYTNADCSISDCKIFDVGGAGLTYQNFPDANDGSDWIFTAANNVGTTANPVGTTAAASGNDLIMLLPNVKSALCLQINRDLDVGIAGTMPVETTGIAVTPFTGSYPGGGPTLIDGDPAPLELDGKQSGCFSDANDGGKTYFYQVLLAR